MEAFVDFFEVGIGDMGINLSGTDVGVSEHGLN